MSCFLTFRENNLWVNEENVMETRKYLGLNKLQGM